MRKLTDSEKFDILINGVLKELYKRDFPFRLTFDIPGTNNAAIMIVIPIVTPRFKILSGRKPAAI